MKTSSLFLTLSLAALAAFSTAACGGDAQSDTGGGGSGGAGGSGGSGGGDQTGVPCDVAQILANKCLTCHGTTPTNSAPMSLVTYDDLVAASNVDPGKKVIERCVTRMGDTGAPMPPTGGATAGEIATLQAWIDAGTPQGDCGDIFDPFAEPIGCQSGSTWTEANGEGPNMAPGEACITCHKNSGEIEAPIFAVAGTVYAYGHETNDCFGINGGSPDFSDVMVEVTEADGTVHKLKPSLAGNFSLLKAGFQYPYTAKVVSSKGERAMTEAQMEGDCNLCHTAQGGGNGSMAPGRIVIPY